MFWQVVVQPNAAGIDGDGDAVDIANATNRVAVGLQNIVAIRSFHQYDKLPTDDLGAILMPTLIGGFFGAIGASYAPEWLLKPLLLGVMIAMTIIMLVKPSVISPPLGTIAYKVKDKPSSWWWLAGLVFMPVLFRQAWGLF